MSYHDSFCRSGIRYGSTMVISSRPTMRLLPLKNDSCAFKYITMAASCSSAYDLSLRLVGAGISLLAVCLVQASIYQGYPLNQLGTLLGLSICRESTRSRVSSFYITNTTFYCRCSPSRQWAVELSLQSCSSWSRSPRIRSNSGSLVASSSSWSPFILQSVCLGSVTCRLASLEYSRCLYGL
jgi:hypothetical protein